MHLEPLSKNVEKMSEKIDALQEANTSFQELFERSDSKMTGIQLRPVTKTKCKNCVRAKKKVMFELRPM